jgi:molybdopterin converting factor small subunit
MTIEIELKLYATLARFKPDSADHYPVDAGTTVDGLIALLELPAKEVKLVFIDGRKAEKDRVLTTGDRVGLFPPVGGG